MKKRIKIIIVVIIILIVLVALPLIWYSARISPVNKKNDKEITVVIENKENPENGVSLNEIAKILKDNNIIRDVNAFKIYVRINGIRDLQQGTYPLNQSMGLKEITDMLKTGKVEDPNQIHITYIEGKNIDWLANIIAEKTNNTKDDVYNVLKDKTYIDSLIDKYWFLTSDIENVDIYYPIEGYLFPDTYTFKNKDVTVKEIFKAMLDQEDKMLSKYKDQIESSKYSIHQIMTIASIVESESLNDEGRKGVASVIYNRLDKGMAIQSDATTYYAFRINMGDRDLTGKELNTYNPYNTRRT